jgi:ssDNA-binding Zn-finger/Zn-ribbon topoisomerase 1
MLLGISGPPAPQRERALLDDAQLDAGVRHFDCPMYEDCLDLAGKHDWTSFSCVMCPNSPTRRGTLEPARAGSTLPELHPGQGRRTVQARINTTVPATCIDCLKEFRRAKQKGRHLRVRCPECRDIYEASLRAFNKAKRQEAVMVERAARKEAEKAYRAQKIAQWRKTTWSDMNEVRLQMNSFKQVQRERGEI